MFKRKKSGKKLRVVAYVRVSTKYESQQTSIPAQIAMIKNFVEENEWELVEIYIDVHSGAKSNREGIQNLMTDAKSKKFDVVVTKEFSRVSRNSAFSYEFYDILIHNQIDLVALDGSVNTLEDNSMNLGLYVWLSENESVRTSRRIKAAYDTRVKLGRFDEAPYGYDLKDGQLYVSSDGSAEVVKQIFAAYIAGKSFDGIARSLYKEDVPTPAKRKGHQNAGEVWHGSTVRQILEREIYTGKLVAKKTSTISPTTTKRIINDEEDWVVRENTHEAIISKEDFELVQQLIKARKRIRSQQTTHIFTGLLICANCGAGMHFKRDRYVCGYQNKYRKKACSENFRPIEKKLIQAILDDLNSLYFSKVSLSSFEKLLDKQVENSQTKVNNDLENLNLKLTSLRKKKQKALELLLDDKIDQDSFNNLALTLNPQIDDLVEKINLLEDEEESETTIDVEELKHYIREKLNPEQVLTELTPEILTRFIKIIKVKADGQLEVHYRTSKPSAFYISTNIKLAIPKTHPNKAYVEKHAQ